MKPYRERVSGWPCELRVVHRKTDMLILSEIPLDPEPVRRTIARLWEELEAYLKGHPTFRMSLEPVEALPGAPAVAVEMANAASRAGVGPMAAVAGAFAEQVAREYEGEIAIENGGDAFVRTERERVFEVFAGNPKIPEMRIVLPPGSWGIATSSGRLGPSLSLGKAWAATVVAESAALSDAWATRLGNEVRPGSDPREALSVIRDADGITGALVIAEESVAIWGLRLA